MLIRCGAKRRELAVPAAVNVNGRNRFARYHEFSDADDSQELQKAEPPRQSQKPIVKKTVSQLIRKFNLENAVLVTGTSSWSFNTVTLQLHCMYRWSLLTQVRQEVWQVYCAELEDGAILFCFEPEGHGTPSQHQARLSTGVQVKAFQNMHSLKPLDFPIWEIGVMTDTPRDTAAANVDEIGAERQNGASTAAISAPADSQEAPQADTNPYLAHMSTAAADRAKDVAESASTSGQTAAAQLDPKTADTGKTAADAASTSGPQTNTGSSGKPLGVDSSNGAASSATLNLAAPHSHQQPSLNGRDTVSTAVPNRVLQYAASATHPLRKRKAPTQPIQTNLTRQCCVWHESGVPTQTQLKYLNIESSEDPYSLETTTDLHSTPADSSAESAATAKVFSSPVGQHCMELLRPILQLVLRCWRALPYRLRRILQCWRQQQRKPPAVHASPIIRQHITAADPMQAIEGSTFDVSTGTQENQCVLLASGQIVSTCNKSMLPLHILHCCAA